MQRFNVHQSVVCVLILLSILLLSVNYVESRRLHRGKLKSMILRQKETNAIEFIRLAVMRLIYGIATRVGLGEQISEALNGAFVPPGVDDYDYSDDLLSDDDYDY